MKKNTLYIILSNENYIEFLLERLKQLSKKNMFTCEMILGAQLAALKEYCKD